MADAVALPKWVRIVRTNPARYERDVFSQGPLQGPSDAARFVRPHLIRQEVENCVVLCLDKGLNPLGLTVVSTGLVDASMAAPREVFRVAIALGASSIVMAHNHPSGNPEPSRNDAVMTRQLVAAGEVLGIPVLDSLIIAGDRVTSLAEMGMV